MIEVARSALVPGWGRLLLLAIVALLLVALLQRASSRDRGRPAAATGVDAGAEVELPAPGSETAGRRDAAEVERETLRLEPAPLAPDVAPSEGIEIFVRRTGEHVGVAGIEVHFIDSSLLAAEESLWDLEQTALRLGRRYRTDRTGVALVPEPRGEFRAVAREPGRFGSVNRFDLATRRAELALAPDPELLARVLDGSGAEVVCVPVRFVCRNREGQGFIHELGETGAHGIARLHPLRSSLGCPRAFVSLAIQDPSPAVVEVDLRQLSAEPVVLSFPETGALDVLVTDMDGRPDESAEQAALEFEPPRAAAALEPGWLGLAEVRAGRVGFPHVRAATPFSVRVGHTRSELLELRPGERRELVLRRHDAGPSVVARVLEAPGVPLAGGLVRLRDLDDPVAWQRGSTLRADAEGFVSWSYAGAGRTFRIELSGADRFRAPASAVLELTPRPGRNDLGDVLLLPTPPLVAGTVVDEEGAPIPGADVTCGVLEPGHVGEPEWRSDLADVTDGEGRFTIHGPAGDAALFLAANRVGYASARDLAARSGATDVRIVLVEQGEITGRILMADYRDRMALQVLARSESDGRFFQGALRSSGEEFEIPQLPEGSYAVLCRWHQNASNVLLVEVTGVRVSAGETVSDPRLDPLDLSTALYEIELELVDTYGRDVREVFLTLRDPRKPRGEPGATFGPLHLSSERGVQRVKCPWPVADLELRAAGLRTAYVANATEAVRVTLQPGLPVRLVPSDATAALLAGPGAEIALQPADQTGQTGWFRDPGFAPWDLGAGTELRVSEPGRYQAVLRVTRRSPGQPVKTESFVAGPALQVIDGESSEGQVVEAPEGVRRFLGP